MKINSKKSIAPLLAIALLGYTVGWSNLLEIRTIEVSGIEGSKTLTAEKVIEKSGIQRGGKLARVNSGVVARALKDYPEIASVEINRKPPHRVEILITTRSIDLAIASGNGKFLLGDITGTTFVEVSKVPRGIPVITGDRRFLSDGMNIYSALPKKIRSRVEKIVLPSSTSISLSLRGGLSILWGSASDQAAKLTVLDALLAAPENKKARFIDIATPLTPIVR
jgi:cell division protein FtsQ